MSGLVSGVVTGVLVEEVGGETGESDPSPETEARSVKRETLVGGDGKSNSPAASPSLSCSTPRKSGAWRARLVAGAPGGSSGPNLISH